MRVRFSGYTQTAGRGGRIRHRVRVEGKPNIRITIPIGPEAKEFSNFYYAARLGEIYEPDVPVAPIKNTLDALIADYLTWLAVQVEGGSMKDATLRQRRSLMLRAADFKAPEGPRMGAHSIDLPPAALIHIQDQWGIRTSQADNCTKALRAMYTWAMERGRIEANPAGGIRKTHRDRGGATPWSADDVRQFLKRHPEGTTARTWLLLALFSGARRSDLAILGRQHEVDRNGVRWIEWQPQKKGSAPVSMPMAPQLIEDIRAAKVIGPTYLLSKVHRPFANGNVLGNNVQEWTKAAGLSGRSSHGVRKALGALLADAGATEHQIMSVMAHTKAATSEIYTRSAKRAGMAANAMALLSGMKFN